MKTSSSASNTARKYYNYIMEYAEANSHKSTIKIDEEINKLAITENELLNILTNYGAKNTKLVIKELDKGGFIIRQGKNSPKSRLRFNKIYLPCYQFIMPDSIDDEPDGEMKIGDITLNVFNGLEEPW